MGDAHEGFPSLLHVVRSIVTRVTHDDVRSLLPSYAAGTLAAERVADVRGHLRECLQCVQGLYRFPVGIPRGKRARAARPVVVERAAGRLGPVLAAIAVALGLTSFLVWTISELLQRRGADTAVRVAAVETERSDLSARIEWLGREIA